MSRPEPHRRSYQFTYRLMIGIGISDVDMEGNELIIPLVLLYPIQKYFPRDFGSWSHFSCWVLGSHGAFRDLSMRIIDGPSKQDI